MRPPNMTCDIRPSWSWTAESSTGWRYPQIAVHHEAMASTSSRPSASRSRTPEADTTGRAGRWAGRGAYGCQTWSRS